jgi:hypothetical protein
MEQPGARLGQRPAAAARDAARAIPPGRRRRAGALTTGASRDAELAGRIAWPLSRVAAARASAPAGRWLHVLTLARPGRKRMS